MRVCSQPGCPTIYNRTEGTRCTVHREAATKAHWAKTKAYNTRGHRIRFRIAVLQRDPICVICNTAQTVVADHHPKGRDELEALGLDPNDPIYGRGLCPPCDKTQTSQRQPGGWHTPQG